MPRKAQIIYALGAVLQCFSVAIFCFYFAVDCSNIMELEFSSVIILGAVGLFAIGISVAGHVLRSRILREHYGSAPATQPKGYVAIVAIGFESLGAIGFGAFFVFAVPFYTVNDPIGLKNVLILGGYDILAFSVLIAGTLLHDHLYLACLERQGFPVVLSYRSKE